MMRAATRIYSSFSCSPATTPPPSPPTIPSTSRATFFKSSENAKSGRHPKMAAAIILSKQRFIDFCQNSQRTRRGRCPHRPKGTIEFAVDFCIRSAFCRGDVGIAPYEKSASDSFS